MKQHPVTTGAPVEVPPFLVKCDDCGWQGDANHDLEDGIAGIEDIWDRLEPGTETPAGECPKCHALVYPVHSPCQRHEDALRELNAWLVSPATDAATLQHFQNIVKAALENLRPH